MVTSGLDCHEVIMSKVDEPQDHVADIRMK
jgi:hypothetical protein